MLSLTQMTRDAPCMRTAKETAAPAESGGPETVADTTRRWGRMASDTAHQ